MKVFIVDSHNGGIADYEDKGVAGSFKFGSNLNIHKDIDSISCQQALTDDLAPGTMTGTTIAIITASNGNTYFFNRDGKIYRRNSSGAYLLVYTDGDGVIKGAAEWYNSNGDTFMYWATDTKLRRKRLPGNGAEPWTDVDATVNGQSYPKTNLTSSNWHTMREVKGVLLGCNDDKLFQVGYDDSYTNEALKLIPGNRSKTLTESDQVGVIGCERKDSRQESSMFYWDSISLTWNEKKLLSSPSINAIVSSDIDLAQVGPKGQVFYLDMLSKKPIFSFPGGGQVNPYGVDVDNGLAIFGVYGNGSGKTGIYSYGSRKKNANYVLNLEYQFDCDEIGATKKVGTDLLFSYKNGSNYGIKKVDTTKKSVGSYVSLDLKAPADLAKEPVWGQMRIFTAPMPENTSIELWRRTDKTGDWIKANTIDGSDSFDIEGGQEGVFSIGDTGKVFEYKLVLNPSGDDAPEVYREEIYFD